MINGTPQGFFSGKRGLRQGSSDVYTRLGSSTLRLTPVIQLCAPGLDGYNAKFFQSAWSLIKTDLCGAVFHFFETGVMLKQFNCASITLVPKLPIPLNTIGL